MTGVSPARRNMIAKVHLGAKELGLDEDARRGLMAHVTGGKRSAADCSDAQLDQIIDAYKRAGWSPSVVRGGKPARSGAAPRRRTAADHPVARKARALWVSLHQLGVVSNPSEQALEAFAKRQLRVDAMQWMDQGQGFRLIEALKSMAKRAGWDQDVGDLEGDEAGALLRRRLQLLLEERG